jgi:copper chaperone
MELKVGGMSCGGCANSVKKAIEKLYPTASVEVTLATGRVVVKTDDTPGLGVVERDRVASAITQAGFVVEEA